MKIVAFDVDGVILDSQLTYIEATNKTLEQYGVTKIPLGEFNKFNVCSLESWNNDVWRYIEDNCHEEIGEKGKYVADYVNNIDIVRANGSKLFDGMRDVIGILNKNGTKICIISNMAEWDFSKNILPLLQEVRIDFIRCREGDLYKPNPKFLDLVLEHFGCEAREITYIGDLYEDYEFASLTGMDFIWAKWGYDNGRMGEVGGVKSAEAPRGLVEMV